MPRILVIDDSKVHRTYARLILEHGGYEVLEAASGQEGLQLVRQQSLDCALLDLLMPGLSGLEVLGTLKEEGFSLPVIVVTAEAGDEGQAECLAAGAVAVVDKASNPERLLKCVLSALNGAPDTTQL